jgi:DNA modification methylase
MNINNWVEAESHRKYHQVANIFPMIEGDEFDQLVADIATNGLKESIMLHPDGSIIDGRNRHRACIEADVKPDFRTWDGDGSLLSFVLSVNLHRRHLTSSQRAALAVEILPILEDEAKQRQQEAGRKYGEGYPKESQEVEQLIAQPLERQPQSRDDAATMTNSNRQYVSDAKRIHEANPEAFSRIKAGEITISEFKRDEKSAALERKKQEIAAQVREQPNQPVVTKADWREWLESQPQCDLLLTDPPYMTEIEDIHGFAKEWLSFALGKVKSTGRAYIFTGAYPVELHAYLEADRAGFELANILVWTYKNTLGPTPSRDYKQNWQAILYFRGPDAPALDCPIMNEQFSVHEVNAPDGRLGDRYHTWQKPDALAERLIRHSTKEGDLILDPFTCTGTFVLAAARLGREGRGCDISHDNLLIAESRGCRYAKVAS